MFLAIFLLLVQCTDSKETCSIQDEYHFCAQSRKFRHEVRSHGRESPSYCYYGDYDDFDPTEKWIKRCGWPGLDKGSCEWAGCCYKDDVCYEPIRAAEIMTYYEGRWVSLETAHATCKRQHMSLFCARHTEDLQFVARATCGGSWLGGQLAGERSTNQELPYKRAGECSKDKINTTCSRDVGVDHEGLSFYRFNREYIITSGSTYDKRNLLCVKEFYAPIFKKYPGHKNKTDSKNQTFECEADKITADGSAVLAADLTWIVRDVSGTEIKRIENPGTSSGEIEATIVGNYTCEIRLRIKPGIRILQLPASGGVTDERTIRAFAYHYLPVNYTVRITIITNTQDKPRVDQEVVENNTTYDLLLSDLVRLDITYQGYPYPLVQILSSSQEKPSFTGGEYFKQVNHDLAGSESWEMANFGEMSEDNMVWEYEDFYEETVVMNFTSKTEHDGLPQVTFKLQKVFIVKQIESPERYLNWTLAEAHQLQCYGYGSGSLEEAAATWSFDGLPFSERNIHYTAVDPDKGMIEIMPTSLEYSGEYVCRLENGAGSANVSYVVKVVAPPNPNLRIKVSNVNATNDTFSFACSLIEEDGHADDYYVFYNELGSNDEYNMTLEDKCVNRIEVGPRGFRNGTWYSFYVQRYIKLVDQVEKKGPPSYVFNIKTNECMKRFDRETYKPAGLIVQQISFKEEKAVVLVRWTLNGYICLVRHFRLEARRGSVDDIDPHPYSELLDRTATSKMLKEFYLDNIYTFTLTTISQKGTVSKPATYVVKLSAAGCPVPPSTPKHCGVLLRNENQLVVVVGNHSRPGDNPATFLECYQGNGASYRGNEHRTVTGELCKHWSQTPSPYKDLPKNFCRNPNIIMQRPWCYTTNRNSKNGLGIVKKACNVPPCGQYLTNITLPSKFLLQEEGTKICLNKHTSDTSVKLVTWYDYGAGADRSCAGSESVLEVLFDGTTEESSSVTRRHNYHTFRKTIWYRYIWLVLGNIQIMVLITAIIYCKRRIVKNLEKDKRAMLREKSIRQAISAQTK